MILEQFSLAGKVAIVTGASRGLGAAMAEALAEAGADLALVSRGDKLDVEVEHIQRLGRHCIGLRADLASTTACSKIVQQTLDYYGSLDILVNCAGTTSRGPALAVCEQDWDQVLNVNLKSVFFLCQAAGKYMVQRKSGKIINIGSLLSFQGGILVAPYTASKSGLAGLTKLLANEWAPHGINVNGIVPGYMATEITLPLQKDPERSASITARIPQGRWGTPDDLKGAVVFLASHASDYAQGQMLVMDGGWLGR
jgi:2-dehydro-3-deoxy-D-gluconate 5-dehydrogenase